MASSTFFHIRKELAPLRSRACRGGGLALSWASKAAMSLAMRRGCSASGLRTAGLASGFGAGLAPSAAKAGRASKQARSRAEGVRMG